jgi:hypothetical protein
MKMGYANPDYHHEWKFQKNKIRFQEESERKKETTRLWRERRKGAEN